MKRGKKEERRAVQKKGKIERNNDRKKGRKKGKEDGKNKKGLSEWKIDNVWMNKGMKEMNEQKVVKKEGKTKWKKKAEDINKK